MSEILFLCHCVPFPPDRGDKIRSWNILRRLAQIAPVHVAAFADDLRDMGFAGALDEVTASTRLVLRDVSRPLRSEEHTSEIQSLMRISYAVFCLKKKIKTINHNIHTSLRQ